MKNKWFLLIIIGFVLLLSTVVSIKPLKADGTYCYGYYWKACATHPDGWVIRCTCTGGAKCWAEWQDLCPPNP